MAENETDLVVLTAEVAAAYFDQLPLPHSEQPTYSGSCYPKL